MKSTTSEYTLTVYVYPSPYGIDWSSPKNLTRTAIRNQFNRIGRSIGHIHIEIKSPQKQILTGMIQKSKIEERKLLFLDQIGFGILLHSFKGALETTEDILKELERRKTKIGKLSFIRFLISKNTFDRLEQYLNEYKNTDLHYGLPNRPRYLEGAGCTAYATSFLEVGGILLDELKTHWANQVRIPVSLLGGRYHPENKKCPLWKLALLSNSVKWAGIGEKQETVHFWDPDRMHSWIIEKWNSIQSSSEFVATEFVVTQDGLAKGLVFDATQYPTPVEPIWKK